MSAPGCLTCRLQPQIDLDTQIHVVFGNRGQLDADGENENASGPPTIAIHRLRYCASSAEQLGHTGLYARVSQLFSS